jgi:hypothetical protein
MAPGTLVWTYNQHGAQSGLCVGRIVEGKPVRSGDRAELELWPIVIWRRARLCFTTTPAFRPIHRELTIEERARFRAQDIEPPKVAPAMAPAIESGLRRAWGEFSQIRKEQRKRRAAG